MLLEDGLVSTLASIQSMVDGSVGIRLERLNALHFALDTGAGFNNIVRGALPPLWDAEVYFDSIAPRLSDANANHLLLWELLWLTVRFGNMKFKVRSIVADRLAVDLIIGTSFLNHYVVAINYDYRKVQFRSGTTPIFQNHHGHTYDH